MNVGVTEHFLLNSVSIVFLQFFHRDEDRPIMSAVLREDEGCENGDVERLRGEREMTEGCINVFRVEKRAMMDQERDG